jgi:predicted DNA-binding ribbon-helix-helix protein
MCEKMMNLDNGVFESLFFDEFELLARDKVKNVRMLVAKVLQKHINKNGTRCPPLS